jgi:uroporphyrinogen decarboxylase
LSRFLDAANRRPVDATPVWLMRQAGRSLPEYRKLRERWSLVEIVSQPELCAEVTLQPVRRLNVDAAVMFADIMLPLRGMGVEFELVENVGPVIAHPVSSAADIERLTVPAGDEAAPQVIVAVRHVVAASPVPVICFAGAPFTLASYLIEGKPSRDFAKIKAFMYSEPAAFDLLLGKLAATMTAYLQAQVAAGAAAVQLFDSWVGALALEDYESRVLPTRTQSSRSWPRSASRPSTSAPIPPACSRRLPPQGRTSSLSTGVSPWTGAGSASDSSAASRETWTPQCSWGRLSWFARGRAMSFGVQVVEPGTSSTSGME